MANLRSNPWSFLPADVVAGVAITSVARNGVRSALVTTGAPHGRSKNDPVSLQGLTPIEWNGGYRVEDVPSATTLLVRIEDWRASLATSGAGNLFVPSYYGNLARMEQLLWDGPTAADVMSLTDLAGNLIWNPVAVTGGSLTYGKLYNVNGLVINAMPSGKLQITVN